MFESLFVLIVVLLPKQKQLSHDGRCLLCWTGYIPCSSPQRRICVHDRRSRDIAALGVVASTIVVLVIAPFLLGGVRAHVSSLASSIPSCYLHSTYWTSQDAWRRREQSSRCQTLSCASSRCVDIFECFPCHSLQKHSRSDRNRRYQSLPRR
jgi:hypothetical protein